MSASGFDELEGGLSAGRGNAAMDELMARARRQLDTLTDVNEQLSDIVGVGRAGNDAVVARVDGVGALVGLEFTGAVGRMTPSALGAAIVAAAADAAAQAYRHRVSVVGDFTHRFTELVAEPPEGGRYNRGNR